MGAKKLTTLIRIGVDCVNGMAENAIDTVDMEKKRQQIDKKIKELYCRVGKKALESDLTDFSEEQEELYGLKEIRDEYDRILLLKRKKVRCPSCGEVNSGYNKFCSECGKNLMD